VNGQVDLHLHSTASDGTVAPDEVVRRAAEAGLVGLSLTDHDTVDGLEEASRAADELGLRFLPGAELSANEPDRSVHVLAFGFDPGDPGLQAFFRAYREDRIRRAREIAERFRSLGVPLEYEAVRKEAGPGVPTRAHVARALVREGLVPDERTVFGKYLSRGKPAFVEKRPTPPSEVFEKVHDAGGVAVLAHPGWTHGPEVIRRWSDEGLDGVEVLHPRNHPKVRRRLDDLAEELGLLRTGGSDWHGPNEEGRPAPGSQEVPAVWMDAVVARCRAAGATVESESG
jgi:predicted metal-dependent phosphoesterase TrpH